MFGKTSSALVDFVFAYTNTLSSTFTDMKANKSEEMVKADKRL